MIWMCFFNVFYMEFNLTNFVGILICFTFFQSFSQQIYELDTSPKCLYNVVVARVFLSILDHVWLLGVSKRNALMYLGKPNQRFPDSPAFGPLEFSFRKSSGIAGRSHQISQKDHVFFLGNILAEEGPRITQKNQPLFDLKLLEPAKMLGNLARNVPKV